MTEFKRTVEELVGVEELLGSLVGDTSTPAPEKLAAFSSAKASAIMADADAANSSAQQPVSLYRCGIGAQQYSVVSKQPCWGVGDESCDQSNCCRAYR